MSDNTPQASSPKFRSISTKMSLIMAAIVLVCTVSTVLLFLVGNFRQSVQAEQQRLESLGSVFRAVLSDPVANNDKAATREVLRALRDIPTLQQAAVHNNDDLLLGEMGGGAVLQRTVLRSGDFDLRDLLTIETLEIKSAIIKGGVTVGSLRLTVDVRWLAARFWTQVAVALVAASAAILLAFMVGNMLIRRASRRLTGLAASLSDIGTKDTLAISLKRETNDEVGVLVDAFNDMMGRIDQRDRALRDYSETLEDTVVERTSELVTARDEAESANAAKSEFLAMMSHEIRTPMNGMMVMAQMLAAAPLSPRHLRFAEIINRSGQNLLAIINDVLDISKIEAGKLVMEANPFSIDDIFADVHGLFFERARERSIALTYFVAPNVPEMLIGDATRINQVVTNLVNNALKFTEKGGVTMLASARQTSQGVKLTIRVKDTGIGIATDKLALVFERFTQADQTITRRFGGTGLGLAISRRLVEAMDGVISVESVDGEGSTFSAEISVDSDAPSGRAHIFQNQKFAISMQDDIQREALISALNAYGAMVASGLNSDEDTILLSDNAQEVADCQTTALFLEPAIDAGESGYRNRGRLALTVPTTRAQLRGLAQAIQINDFSRFRSAKRMMDRAINYNEYRGLRALAVDDNTVNRDVLSEALGSMGIEVDTAINGEDALIRAGNAMYDIIFMDCSMPVMDGFTASRILREREKDTGKRTPIVAITALSDRSGKDDWRHAGMDGWIAKPFTIPTVAEHISTLVLKHEANGMKGLPMNEEQRLAAQFERAPIVDEQTLRMISQLGSQGSDPAAKRIRDLFVTSANNALTTLAQGFAAQDHEKIAESAYMLRSVSESIGATRLAAVAAHIQTSAKAGETPAHSIEHMLYAIFAQSELEIAGRLGLGFEAKAAQG